MCVIRTRRFKEETEIVKEDRHDVLTDTEMKRGTSVFCENSHLILTRSRFFFFVRSASVIVTFNQWKIYVIDKEALDSS